jgi:hypothetical protein
MYLRGQAYLALRQGQDAQREFHRILSHRGVVQNLPIGALAHLGAGRSDAVLGDIARARTEYQDFLTLWENADPDIPILKQAQSEYAALR